MDKHIGLLIPTGRILSRCSALLGIGWCLLFSGNLYGGSAMPGTHGELVFPFKTPKKTTNIKVYYFAAEKLRADSPIVFVLHSDSRNGKVYCNEWSQYAKKYRFLVVCPEFSKKDFPYWKYNCGNVYDQEKRSFRPKDQWTFNAIEQLFDFVKDDRQIDVDSYCIFGHSSGAQFVQRMVLFMPEAKFSVAIANGAGWYTMPSFEQAFDRGIRNSPLTNDTLKQAFEKDLVILMGAKDKVSKEMPPSYAETTHKWDRLWRAKFFYKDAQSKAEELGVEMKWKFRLVANADHNNPAHAAWASGYIARSRARKKATHRQAKQSN